MSNFITCPQCGAANIASAIYCIECSHRLAPSLYTPEKKPYPELEEKLEQLANSTGFIIVASGDYYVQFINNLHDKELYIEAVSEYYLPQVGNKDEAFKPLGYVRESDTNYYKRLPHALFSPSKMVEELQSIFDGIYKVPFALHKVDYYVDGLKGNKTNIPMKKSKAVSIIFSVIALLVMLILGFIIFRLFLS